MNPLEYLQYQLARRRYLPRTRVTRAGTVGKVSLAALGVIVAISALLELRGSRESEVLAQLLEDRGTAPLELVQRAALRRRLVFLADIPGSVATKQFFADAVERVALGSGLDLVGLEVDPAEQRYIDAYLSTQSEDVGILLARPRAIHEHQGVANAYLAIYRRVRQLNEDLGPDRRIRILALDAEDWPPVRALPPNELARRFGARDSIMSLRLQQVLRMNPRTRSLLLVNGLSALRAGGGFIQTGGTRSIPVAWAAARLARVYPQDVYSILVDAPVVGAARVRVAAYRGTAAGPLLAERYRGAPAALAVAGALAAVRHPARAATTPGISFDLTPRSFSFGEAADAYVYLGQ
jgi:hypothetical protein